MAEVTIFHNPRCSKSRQALDLLRDRGVDTEIVEYLKHPPSASALRTLARQLDGDVTELIRAGDAKAKDIDTSGATDTAGVVALLCEHPELLQRPIVVKGGRAVIGRPTERIDELLS